MVLCFSVSAAYELWPLGDSLPLFLTALKPWADWCRCPWCWSMLCLLTRVADPAGYLSVRLMTTLLPFVFQTVTLWQRFMHSVVTWCFWSHEEHSKGKVFFEGLWVSLTNRSAGLTATLLSSYRGSQDLAAGVYCAELLMYLALTIIWRKERREMWYWYCGHWNILCLLWPIKCTLRKTPNVTQLIAVAVGIRNHIFSDWTASNT